MALNSFVQQINGLSVDRQVIAQIITLKDNLTHPYFSSIDLSRDNSSPIGIAKFHAVYDQQIMDYWTKYDDVVVISFNISDVDRENTNSLNFSELNGLNGRIQNDEYNYSFICKVSRLKQKGKEIIIFLEDLGWKFLQKVPNEFRQTYIANQYLDDAFQAMCEFLDVHFAYSIEDLHQFQFGADGYSITKDGQLIEEVQTILTTMVTDASDAEDPLDDPIFEDQGLFDLLTGNEQETTEDQSASTNQTLSENADASLEKKIQEHQEDFDKKIQDLFIGNTYYDSDLTHPVLDYGRITITPSSNNNSTLNNTESSTPEETSEEEQQLVGTNPQIHQATQNTMTGLAKTTKAILNNPKAMKTLGGVIFGQNVPKGSVANFLNEATTDKKKQKQLASALKTYMRNPNG